jgi:hypothetical protein
MKRSEIFLLRFFQLMTWFTGSVVALGLAYTIVQLVNGNVHSTSAFEF